MLRQTEWRIQMDVSQKMGVLTVTTLTFSKFCFSLRTSYKDLI